MTMPESFPSAKGKEILVALITTIQKNAQYLSEVDGAIGDGDHGINMNKGFSQAMDLIPDGMGLSDGLNTLGEVLLTNIGGSMGPLYGTFFMDMASACEGENEIDGQVFGKMLKAGREGIQGIGNAKVGDKTLIDTLVPAEAAFLQAINTGLSFSAALKAMSAAAEKGKESTRDMVAKIGRASRLGERSRGVLDAGATSASLLLQAFDESINHLLS